MGKGFNYWVEETESGIVGNIEWDWEYYNKTIDENHEVISRIISFIFGLNPKHGIKLKTKRKNAIHDIFESEIHPGEKYYNIAPYSWDSITAISIVSAVNIFENIADHIKERAEKEIKKEKEEGLAISIEEDLKIEHIAKQLGVTKEYVKATYLRKL